MTERPPLTLDDRIGLARPIRVQWEKAQKAWVLLYPKGNVRLNETAGEILQRCKGDKTIRELVAELEREFQGTDMGEDILEFLEVAHGKGWVERKSD